MDNESDYLLLHLNDRFLSNTDTFTSHSETGNFLQLCNCEVDYFFVAPSHKQETIIIGCDFSTKSLNPCKGLSWTSISRLPVLYNRTLIPSCNYRIWVGSYKPFITWERKCKIYRANYKLLFTFTPIVLFDLHKKAWETIKGLQKCVNIFHWASCICIKALSSW